MTDSGRYELRVEAPQTRAMMWFGVAVAAIGAIALVGAFIADFTVPALIVALAALILGIMCLAIDRRVNLFALAGIVASSVAVSVAIITRL